MTRRLPADIFSVDKDRPDFLILRNKSIEPNFCLSMVSHHLDNLVLESKRIPSGFYWSFSGVLRRAEDSVVVSSSSHCFSGCFR